MGKLSSSMLIDNSGLAILGQFAWGQNFYDNRRRSPLADISLKTSFFPPLAG
jgi:hypothetical protein